MEITAKELRGKPGKIIEQAARGTEVIITIRGKKMARLVPYERQAVEDSDREPKDELFGLWKGRDLEESVDAYVRSARKRRVL
jgi:prevent-host-death family protein